MTKRSDIKRQIASLEAELERTPRRQARKKKSADDEIIAALNGLEAMVKQACGESFMEEELEEDILSPMGYMDEDMAFEDDLESPMGYMDEDMAFEDDLDAPIDDMDYMDYMDDEGMEEDILLAEDGTDYPNVPAGAEQEITQDYLDDVIEEEKNPSSIVTDSTIQDAAPGGYVANMIRASKRLDRVATYCEQQGNKKLAFHIDKIADALDARIKKEAR